MNFNDLVKAVSDECPDFNDYALRGFVKDNIDMSPKFPAMVLSEGFKLVGNSLELVGDPEILSPEDTVLHELTSGSSKSGKAKIPLTVTHMRLVRYNVKFGDKNIPVHLYMPYMYNDMLMIRDKYSMIRKVILEQTFSRVSEKDKDGMSLSPIRVNIVFNRRITFKIHSYTTGGFYDHFIVTSRLFHGPITNKVCETTLVHYMLAKFGFLKTLAKFGLQREDIDFTETVGQDTDQFEYFAAKQYNDKTEQGPGLFLRVNKILLGDDQTKKFVVNLLYTLSHFKIQSIDNVYAEQGSIWKVMLGVILFPDPAGPKAHSNAESHLNSVDSFIDPMTSKRLRTFGVMINDIYDILVYVFGEIDSFMVNNQVQDLYNSRLDVANGLLVKSYGTRMTKQIYPLAKRSNISERDVKNALRINPMMFKHSSSGRPDEDKDYLAPPEIIGDNYLLSGGLSKIRMGGRPEQRFHASMMVAESGNAFVGKTIGRTGYLNPYIPTDANGAIVHPDYAEEIDKIKSALPR
jgi:hypothetical protein